MAIPDFSTVTELPEDHATAEQLSMIHTRYRLAAQMCDGKDVLEAACGTGRALGYLSRRAKSIVGGDITPALVDRANEHYAGLIKIVQMDAQRMPWADGSFDVVILFEALYYLSDIEAFFKEVRRILRPGGRLVLCTPNREWREFNPSPFSREYFSAAELRVLLDRHGFDAELRAGFPVESNTWGGKLTSAARRVAIGLGLMPKTMTGKAILKRIFYGRLAGLGREIDTTAPVEDLALVGPGPVADYKVLYAIANLR